MQRITGIAREATSPVKHCQDVARDELAWREVVLDDEVPLGGLFGTPLLVENPARRASSAPPGFARDQRAMKIWAERGCARLVRDGPDLARARQHFLRRAAALGYRRTPNPMLRLLAAGRMLRPERAALCWQVDLPCGTAEVRLVSRTWVPAQMRPAETDTRVLGVAISRLALDDREVALDSPALKDGWLAPERGWRWTDGAGVVPVGAARRLTFELVMAGEYWAGR